jgi:hypothetical protein
MKKVSFSFILFLGVVAHSQNVISKEQLTSHKNWSRHKTIGLIMAETDLSNELYMMPSEKSYEQKIKTSLIIGLSLLPPTVLFAKLAEPIYPYDYKIGWGAAAFATGSTALFYLIRYAVLKKSKNRKK